MTRLWALGLFAWMCIFATTANAHPMPQSFVQVYVSQPDWRLSLRLPSDRLAVAFIQAGLIPDPGPGFTAYPPLRADMVKAYIQDRVIARSLNGAEWGERVLAVRPPQGKADEWQVDVELTPPAGPMPTTLMLDYEVIVRELATHSAVVSVTEGWPSQPRLLGALRADTRIMRIDRQRGNGWRVALSMVLLGAHHIAEGTDHLLFLLALLLPAPLLAAGKIWGEYGGLKYTFQRLLKVITAFTIGHSATLILGAFGGIIVPQQPVEVLIALSIFFSAIHAWRPVFRGREIWIAAGFGLIHGMSFAAVISSVGMNVWQKAGAILGFNLGIELVQIVIVCLVVPWLILLARAHAYTPLRLAGAALAAVSSVAWAVARISGHPNLVSILVEGLLSHAVWGIVLLVISATGLTLMHHKQDTKIV